MSSQLLYQAAKDTLVEYIHKTSLNGCYLLYNIRRRKYQRLLWFIFIALAVCFATYVCITILSLFLKDPTVTTLDPQEHSVYDVPFPSVAVCSYNKFSREAIRKFALNITSHRSNNETLEYWEHRLEILSGIYNSDSLDFEEAYKLHFELESAFGKPYRTSNIIEVLTPSCEDFIVKCFWAGETINCKDKFELKIFMDGPCCVFNYQYMKNLDSLFYPNSTGPERGLAILLNSSTNDYFYAEDSTVGFQVKLFSNQRIPDTTMGDMEEFHVGIGEDVDVSLDLVSQVTMEDVRVYSAQKRGCYFPYEHKKATFDKSECLLICKVLAIQSECECLPFYAINSGIVSNRTDKAHEECTLLSLNCLELLKYDSIKCLDCLPMCSYNHYYFRKTVNDLKYTSKLYENSIYLTNMSYIQDDLSLVKIYYPEAIGTRYNKNVLYNWYHILSNIGGVIGICMGCSIISGIEIIYFSCFRLLENYSKLRKT